MTLHCFSRLGLLSYVYEQRHELAYALGVVAEIPIPLCNSNYDFTKGLVIQNHDIDQSNPKQLAQAHEINLFFNAIELIVEPSFFGCGENKFNSIPDKFYHSPSRSIFHPPSFI